MKYVTVKHKIPECFRYKILQDNLWDELRSQTVIPITSIRELKKDLELTRYSCQEFIKKQRGNKSGSTG